MQPRCFIAAAFCVLAVFGLLCAAGTLPALAKSAVAEKSGGKKQTAVASHGKKQTAAASKKKSAAKKSRSSVTVKREPATNPEPRTPTDKQDCIAAAQAFYEEAGKRARGMKQAIPEGFIRVVSKPDEFCGEEEFDKARASIDWMDTCLKDLADNHKTGFCSNSSGLSCAVDPQVKACTANGRLAEQ